MGMSSSDYMKQAFLSAALAVASVASISAHAADAIKIMKNGVQVASVDADKGIVSQTAQQEQLHAQNMGLGS